MNYIFSNVYKFAKVCDEAISGRDAMKKSLEEVRGVCDARPAELEETLD